MRFLSLARAEDELTLPCAQTHPDCPPLSFTLAPSPPSLPPSSSTAPSAPAPSPAPAPAPRLVATHLRFAHAAQLVAALGVLDAQMRANALVRSAVVPLATLGDAARPAKRARAQKGKSAGGMTLDELFARASLSLLSLPLSPKLLSLSQDVH